MRAAQRAPPRRLPSQTAGPRLRPQALKHLWNHPAFPSVGEGPLHIYVGVLPSQVPKASPLLLALHHRSVAKEVLLEEAALGVLKLRLSSQEPRLPGPARRVLGPLLRPRWVEMPRPLHGASNRKAARAGVGLLPRTCSQDKWRGKGPKHISALSPEIRFLPLQSRNCG